jgi:hypothetical protein
VNGLVPTNSSAAPLEPTSTCWLLGERREPRLGHAARRALRQAVRAGRLRD